MRHVAGIGLSPAKKALVCSRLARRLQQHGLASFRDYLQLIDQHAEERQTAIDLLTTNETHFFREPRHFDFVRERVLPQREPGRSLRAWSAACSSGQEVYSLAMVLADALGPTGWEVLGSDLSLRVLRQACSAQYDLRLAQEIPPALLRAHCLRGTGDKAGTFAIDPALARQVRFAQINLNEPLPELGEFDLIFLRNVMIYFPEPVKRQVVGRLVARLRPGGWIFVGHSESLNGLADGLQMQAPSVYRKSR
ncbi:MAG: CheR family methyltransferase [Pseudomonadota bacterium]